jgi:hypothetical protein
MIKGINSIKHWEHWGVLFSLTKNKWFNLKKEENCKVLTYDEYYLIYGNSEIRIRDGEFQVYSSFGGNSGYFNNGSETQTILLDEKSDR